MIQDFWNFIVTPLSLGENQFAFSILDIFLKLLLPLVLAFFVYNILNMLEKKFLSGSKKMKEQTRDRLRKYIRRSLKIILLLVVIVIVINFLKDGIIRYLGIFWGILNTPFITSDNVKISIVTVLLTIPVFIFSSWISGKVKDTVDRSLLRTLSLPAATKFSISKLIRYGVLSLLVIFGLSLIGIDFSSLTVILGVFGLGVGFGLQTIVANFFSGIVIFFEQPVKEGDRIVVDGLEGDIFRIRMLSTIITTLDNENIFIPNSKLIGNNIYNYSYNNLHLILVNQVSVSYASDLEKVQAVLLEVAKANPHALSAMAPEVRVMEFGDSGILMELRTWIRNAGDKQAAHAWTNFRIWKDFKRNNVEIPFPQLDLHIKRPPARIE